MSIVSPWLWLALLRGSLSPCHPVIYELEPVKNTNKISIFYYFLDTVDKPRYDTEGVFLSMRAMPL
ncbi:MAG: palindromic element RPE4 domain-containing protein [Janthinobacterium lividum]